MTNLNKTAGPVEETGVFNDPNRVPGDDSPYALSPKRQVGHGISFSLFGGGTKNSDQSAPSVVDDPEYAEYLEWKRWQEFKAYQKWKSEQALLQSS